MRQMRVVPTMDGCEHVRVGMVRATRDRGSRSVDHLLLVAVVGSIGCRWLVHPPSAVRRGQSMVARMPAGSGL